MRKSYSLYLSLGAMVIFGLTACKKYLDAKPDATLATLTSVEDIQTLLDNPSAMNLKCTNTLESGSDLFYVNTTDWNSLVTTAPVDAKLYRWEKAVETSGGFDVRWNDQYNAIFQSNIALFNLDLLENAPTGSDAWNNVKGSALFFRGFYYYILSQLFVPPYDPSNAASLFGMPLRLDPDFEKPSVRSTVQQTYDQVLNDLKASADLLPVKPLVKTRPSKPAAFGMLARTYLSMRMYDSAGVYANKCLQLYDSLMDFNLLNAASLAPISRFNKEVIFHARTTSTSTLLAAPRAKVDSVLYTQYDTNDLRKTIYFTANTGANAGTYSFKGDYDGAGANASGYVFAGIVTDEMYLVRAECYARAGNLSQAMQDLNTLMEKRWKQTFFVPFSFVDQTDAIKAILAERKKELFFRGARWTDMRRLQWEPAFAVSAKRLINNQEYQLLPNSTSYTLQIPADVILVTGMQQNP